MNGTLHVAIVGTGFLGRVLVHKLRNSAVQLTHTFNAHRNFADSIPFNLFHQDFASLPPASGIDVVIFATRFEVSSDTEAVHYALERNLRYLKSRRVIYISSDAVFDGKKGMYSEDDLPSPLTTYGKNKLLCESMLRDSIPNHCIVRTSYIYGHSAGQFDPRLTHAQRLIQAGQVFERFEDMYKSPIEVSRLSDAIVALTHLNYCGIIHIAGERMSVYEFYRRALLTLGNDCRAVRPAPIPNDPPQDFLADTSLDASFSKRLLGIEPGTIESSLSDVTTPVVTGRLQCT